MKHPESLPHSAPEIFDRWYKPSELAHMFGLYAEEMVAAGLAVRRGESVVPPPGKGLNINFHSSGEVKSVYFRESQGSNLVDYFIEFTPGDAQKLTYKEDGSVARFSIRHFNEPHELQPPEIFERKHFTTGDIQVNEFFRDMGAAIQPKRGYADVVGLA